jgi:LPS export ABC transporter protein LptC
MRLSQIHTVRVLLLVIAVMCLLVACENSQKEIDEQFTNRPLQEVAKDIDSYLSQDGKIKARLRAPTMIRSMVVDTQLVLFPDKLHCDFYNDSTELETWVDSKHGKYYENLNKVYLWDSVVVINVKGDTLKAADLWWDQNTKLFYTDKYAEYRTKDRQLYPGKGLEATQDFTRVYFKYPTGRLKVKEDGFPE